jgi:hypothetical protein
MNDSTEWGEPVDEGRSRRSEKRQRAAMISIRVTAEELSAVQEAATARGLSVSRYVRDCALRPVRFQNLNPFGLLVANGTWEDKVTSAGTLTSPIDVPTVTAPSAGFYFVPPVGSSAAS